MKILIDGCVFTQQGETELCQFWREIIPGLVTRLSEHQVYFLNRASSPAFEEIVGKFKNLVAPPVEFEQFFLEERRLSALCRALGVDVFISTYNTSAGAQVRSLFVAYGWGSDVSLVDRVVLLSRERVIKFASSYLAIFQNQADNPIATYNLPQDKIRVIYPETSTGELDWEAIAVECAIAVENIFNEKLTPEMTAWRMAEEEAASSEAESLQQAIEEAVVKAWEMSKTSTQSLSVCMMVQNSEKTLALALESLGDVYDDLIIVDGGSTDSTCQIALSYGARIIYSRWKGNHSAQRNVYLKEVKTDWVFVIDSDEFIDRKTLDFLRFIKTNGKSLESDNYWITRKWISPFSKTHYIGSEPHYPDWQRRIFKYNKSIYYSGQIHEEIHGLMQSSKSLIEDLSVYHLDLLIKSEAERQEKVRVYMKGNPKDGMPHFYLPDVRQLSLEKWDIQDLLPEVRKLLNDIPIKCKICDSDSNHFANAKVLGKYSVDFFRCSNCGFVQTENPYWLEEAYSEPIAGSDVGLVLRNVMFSKVTSKLIFNCFDHQARFIDYGGGYGLFVRLMRDAGFDFYWVDKFCQNIFAKGFEVGETENNQFEVVTAFEVFEHLVNPIVELKEVLKFSKNILFSTELLPGTGFHPHEWWYYSLDEGQHISLYTLKSLAIIADKLNLNLYSNGSSLHLLTEKELPENLFERLSKGELAESNKTSLLQSDYLKILKQLERKNNTENLNDSINERDSSRTEGGGKIVIDGVFFQLYQTGIARVWQSLLSEWAANGFAKHIVVLDRAGTAPKINGVWYREIPAYDYNNIPADREMLQQVCDEEGADLFISTYYTIPVSTPSAFMAYDMIPEIMGWEPDHPYWKGKHDAIKYASAYIAISENTARDLVRVFPEIPLQSIDIAYCGVAATFYPASLTDINRLKTKYGIAKPYFILVGTDGYQKYKNKILFFQGFAQLATGQAFDIVCTGGGGFLADNLRAYTSGSTVYMLQLDDQELRSAYSGAVALVYPSKYEGFGLPVLEALACGCPVITCPNASIPEVAGQAALYVNDNDVDGLANALCEVQKPNVRKSLIAAGLEQAKKFSWSNMATKVSSALINTTLLPLKLKGINLIIFPDWSQPEETLELELARVLRAIAIHPDKSQIALLVDITDISNEEDANLILSSVTMNFLMQEDLDVTEGPEISLFRNLGDSQWAALLPLVQARIILDQENEQTISSFHLLTAKTTAGNITACRLEDLNKIGAGHPQLATPSNLTIKSNNPARPRIDVVLQSCGLHGWNLWRGWANVLQKAGLLNRVFAPIADWGAEEPNNDDGLFEYLKNPEADLVLLLGFDWHSQPLHKTAKWQNQWHQAPIKKVAILQECYSAQVVQNTSQWKLQVSQALVSTIPCVDVLVCHHEPDVQFLQEQANVSLPTIFLPFAIDPEFFKIKIPFNQRLNRAAFRGNISAYFTQETYQDRRRFIELLRQCGNVDIFEFQYNASDTREFKTIEGVESYADRLNAYQIQLNLPSISATLTNRPFEVMACGSVLIQNNILGEVSNQLFQNLQHLVYYEQDNPEDLINKINHIIANPDVAHQIAQSGHQLCYEKHTIANRIQSILEFLGINFEVFKATLERL